MRWILLAVLLVGCGNVTETERPDAADGAAAAGGGGGGGTGGSASAAPDAGNPCDPPVLAALDGTATYVPGSQRASDPLAVVGDHTCADAVARLGAPVATLPIVDGVARSSGASLDTAVVSGAPAGAACAYVLRIAVHGSAIAEGCSYAADYALSVPR